MACYRFPRLCRNWIFAIAISTPLGLLATAQIVHSRVFDATDSRGSVDLPAPWLVHLGDDPAFARPDFDDSGWTSFDARNSLKTIVPHGSPGIVWVSPPHESVAKSNGNGSSRKQHLVRV